MSAPSSSCRRLPLHSRHAARGAKFGSFGDWEVPLYYRGILEEHEAVRTRAGLFDISHMAKFLVTGAGAASYLQFLLPRDVKKMAEGRALYMPLLNEAGRVLDDLVVYRAGRERFWVIANAANAEKDDAWMRGRAGSDLALENCTDELALLALQGPGSPAVLEKIFASRDWSGLRYYGFREWGAGFIARTGYTGEDGFEILASHSEGEDLWDAILGTGGVEPAGFGARDTLRLEAGMLLCGHDISEDMSPLEGGLEWTLDWAKGAFVGCEALEKEKKAGLRRKIAGFEMIERGIPREGYPVSRKGRAVGRVTSGSFAPTLKKNIGLALVEADSAEPGVDIEVEIRGRTLGARVVGLPFYKRAKAL